MIKIQSVFSDGNQAAICLFVIEDKAASLESVWKSTPNDYFVATAAVKYGRDSRIVVNPDPQSEKSFLKTMLLRHGFEDVRISKPIQPIEGLLTITELLSDSQLITDRFEGWPRLHTLLKRASENMTAEAAVVFQGAIAIQKLLNPPAYTFCSSVDPEERIRRQRDGRLYGIL